MNRASRGAFEVDRHGLPGVPVAGEVALRHLVRAGRESSLAPRLCTRRAQARQTANVTRAASLQSEPAGLVLNHTQRRNQEERVYNIVIYTGIHGAGSSAERHRPLLAGGA